MRIIGIKDFVSAARIYRDGTDDAQRQYRRENVRAEENERERERERSDERSKKGKLRAERGAIAKSHCAKLAVELCCDFLKSRKRRPAEGNASTTDGTSFPRFLVRRRLRCTELTSAAFFHACLHDDV